MELYGKYFLQAKINYTYIRNIINLVNHLIIQMH